MIEGKEELMMYDPKADQYIYPRHGMYQPYHSGPMYAAPPMMPTYETISHNLGNRQQLLMEDAIVIARQQVPGLVVEAELKQKQGRQLFEVEIITSEGVKYEVEIDAMSGEVVKISLD